MVLWEPKQSENLGVCDAHIREPSTNDHFNREIPTNVELGSVFNRENTKNSCDRKQVASGAPQVPRNNGAESTAERPGMHMGL